MVKGAEGNKKFEENSKTQNEIDVTKKPKSAVNESAAKFKAFVESIKDDENAKYVDAVIKGFDVIFPE